MSAVQGAIGGAGTGAAIGSAILPGIGTAIGGLLGAVTGGISGGKADKELKAATAQLNAIPLVDPMMMDVASQIQREKRSVDSGFSTDFQVGNQAIQAATASGVNVAGNVYGQNPALMLASINRIQRVGGQQTNQMMGVVGQKSMQYSQMLKDTMERISQRKLDLQMHKAQQRLGAATQTKQDVNQNMLAGMMMLPGVVGDLGKLPGQLGGLFKGGAAGAGAVAGVNPATTSAMNAMATAGLNSVKSGSVLTPLSQRPILPNLNMMLGGLTQTQQF